MRVQLSRECALAQVDALKLATPVRRAVRRLVVQVAVAPRVQRALADAGGVRLTWGRGFNVCEVEFGSEPDADLWVFEWSMNHRVGRAFDVAACDWSHAAASVRNWLHLHEPIPN